MKFQKSKSHKAAPHNMSKTMRAIDMHISISISTLVVTDQGCVCTCASLRAVAVTMWMKSGSSV